MSQPHYTLKYSAMQLSFDVGNDGLVYNVAKYLTRSKGDPLEDAHKALDLVDRYQLWAATAPPQHAIRTPEKASKDMCWVKKFCDQFPVEEGARLYSILYGVVIGDMNQAKEGISYKIRGMEDGTA